MPANVFLEEAAYRRKQSSPTHQARAMLGSEQEAIDGHAQKDEQADPGIGPESVSAGPGVVQVEPGQLPGKVEGHAGDAYIVGRARSGGDTCRDEKRRARHGKPDEGGAIELAKGQGR